MNDFYETKFGIYDHLRQGKQRPLASVALHECENINDGSLLEAIIRTYVRKGVKDLYGMHLEEFLSLPMDIAEMLIRIADDERAAKQQTYANIEKEFQVK